jgi:acetyl-CoA carboxylase biotin carboxyl carrier protein
MDLRKLKTLIDLVSESNVSELEITEAEGKVRIVKGGGVPMAGMHAPMMSPGGVPAAAPAVMGSAAVAPGNPAAAAQGELPAAAPVASHRVIKSPMVGTFYRSASPGAKPFVEQGSVVKAGDTVCIVEAMKILNEIESDLDGTITRILCENGQAVEFGQPLFEVE